MSSEEETKRLEDAADRLVEVCTALGLSRKDVASVALAIALNHMIASGVSEERAVLATGAMYRWRVGRKSMAANVLVPE